MTPVDGLSCRAVGFVTPGASRRAISRLLAEGDIRLIVEDAATGHALEALRARRWEPVADLVSGIRDIYDPEVTRNTARVLRQLAEALRVSEWTCAGIPLWDVVAIDFLWQCLEGLFQATDIAKQLLAATGARRLVISGADSPLARALVAVAQAQSLEFEVLAPWRPGGVSGLRARFLPYLGHFRESARALPFRLRPTARRGAPFVIVSHVARTLFMMQPVLKELSERVGTDRVLVLQVGPEGVKEVREAGFAYTQFESYAVLSEGVSALREAAPAVAFLTSGAWKASVAKAGVQWEGVPLEVLAEQEISFFLARLLGSAAREIACARRILSREAPALVCLTDERAAFARAIGLAARATGVASLMVQWGPIAPNSTWVPGVTADVAAVEGEVAAEVIRACENAPDLRIVITGQPKYDLLLEQSAAASKSEICARYGLDPDRPIVLYASPAVRERSATMRRSAVEEAKLSAEVAAVCRAARSLAGVQLLVKPHPNEGAIVHKELLERWPSADTYLISKSETVYPLLFISDVVVTHHSTVGLEGAVLGKPVVIVNLTGRPDAIPYVEGGVALGAYREADVRTALEAVLYDPRIRECLTQRRTAFLRQHAFRDGMPATGRMTTLMLDMERNT